MQLVIVTVPFIGHHDVLYRYILNEKYQYYNIHFIVLAWKDTSIPSYVPCDKQQHVTYTILNINE